MCFSSFHRLKVYHISNIHIYSCIGRPTFVRIMISRRKPSISQYNIDDKYSYHLVVLKFILILMNSSYFLNYQKIYPGNIFWTATGMACPSCDDQLNCTWNQTCIVGSICMIRSYDGYPFTTHCIDVCIYT